MSLERLPNVADEACAIHLSCGLPSKHLHVEAIANAKDLQLSKPYLSLKCGRRFSKNACMPSFWSSRAKADQNSLLHCGKAIIG